jgi:hypothetical protein
METMNDFTSRSFLNEWNDAPLVDIGQVAPISVIFFSFLQIDDIIVRDLNEWN